MPAMRSFSVAVPAILVCVVRVDVFAWVTEV